MNFKRRIVFVFFVVFACASFTSAALLFSQEREAALPLRRVTLFSSGVGFFEHSGVITGKVRTPLFFNRSTINDALKSLVINDPDSTSSTVRYVSDATLERTLQRLKIDLSGNPEITAILDKLQGVEVDLSYEENGKINSASGRIVSVGTPKKDSTRSPLGSGSSSQGTIAVSTPSGIKVINLNDITNINFHEKSLNKELNYALDLISAERDTGQSRAVYVDFQGSKKREVSLSYVIPVPVWKLSYRLDLTKTPVLQAWAIIDNDGDMDWRNVEVSLVSGRPVSFIQPLYQPYYTERPTLPLAGAGFAEAELFDSGWTEGAVEAVAPESARAARSPAPAVNSAMRKLNFDADSAFSVTADGTAGGVLVPGGAGASRAGETGGEQFEFTLKKPVNLARQQSAMFPVFEGAVKARKVLVFPGERTLSGSTIHPAVCAEITNTTGINLPAASITVFDMGNYAGDALISFLPENDKRLVSYGEDLSISGESSSAITRNIDSATLNRGIINIKRKLITTRKYTIRNSSNETKTIIIEHPKTPNTVLVEPAAPAEQTAALYRFEETVKGKQILNLDVSEERLIAETNKISDWNLDTLLAYSSNGELPDKVKTALETAYGYKLNVENAKKELQNAQETRQRLIDEQARIRENLKVVGTDSPEGRNYIQVLTGLDGDIASATQNIDALKKKLSTAEEDFASYVNSLVV